MAELLNDDMRNVVAAALMAYNSMETTKRRHFDYLNLLEAKRKKFNLEATSEESDLLASLLKDHDYAVKSFKQEANLLQSTEPAAHMSLFKYIGLLNEVISEPAVGSDNSH